MSARDIRQLLHHRLIPAMPTPFTNGRIIHHDSHVRMADYMSDMPIGGVAVWAHTGRGLLLTEEERAVVLTHWRESLPDRVIIAGAGSREMAEHAKFLGADAILCHPPTHLRAPAGSSMSRDAISERDEAISAYHRELARPGLPLILFYLYEAAGGLEYSQSVLRKLFNIPNVIGIKIATLDSVMTFQDLARWTKAEYPEKLLITGEDRFLGYSLIMGADAALVGMGAALTPLQAEMIHAFYAQDFDRFLFHSKIVDQFAMSTFYDPMEGYISRMLYALSWLGVVSPEAVHDPWGPELAEGDLQRVGDFLTTLPTELKR